MRHFVPLFVLCGLLASLLCAQDPPKKLTSEERKELNAKWETRMNAAIDAAQSGRHRDAEKSFEAGLAVARQLYPKEEFPDGHPDLVMTLSALGAFHQRQGKHADAEPFLEASLVMSKQLFKGDHPRVASCLNQLAEAYHGQGRLSEAEPLYKQAVAMRKRLFKGDHPQVSSSLTSLAGLYQEQGKYTVAEPLLKESLEMNQRLFKGDHLEIANTLNNLGILYRSQGKFTLAEPYLKDTLEMHRRLFKGDHPGTARCLSNLGTLYQSLDNYEKAEPYFKDGLAMARRLFKGDHFYLATSINNLAVLYVAQRKYTEAEPLYKETLEIYRRLFKRDHANTALTMTNLGVLCANVGKYADAESLAHDALAMRQRLFTGDHPSVAQSLNNLGALYHKQGKLAEAARYLKDALEMYRRMTVHFAQERTEGEALTLLASQPRPRDLFLTTELARESDPATVYPHVWFGKGAIARIYEQRQQQARAASGEPRVAVLLAELSLARRQRAELLLTPLAQDAAQREKRTEAIKAHEARITELTEELRPLLPAIARTEKLAAASPSELQTLLPADAAVVDYLRFVKFEHDPARPGDAGTKQTPGYLAFVLTKDRLAWVDLKNESAINEAVNTWREAITGGKEIPVVVPAKVRELIWEKVRKELPANVKTVYIAPDLALCRVPWAALPGDKPGTILLEDFTLATVPHAGYLLDQLSPRDQTKNPPADVLIVGGVNYEAETAAGPANRDLPLGDGVKAVWPTLPGAAAEATGVTRAAEKKKLTVTPLAGERATPAAVLAALPKARHAHFATHGFFADPSFASAFQLNPRDFDRSARGERIGASTLSPLVMTGLVFAGANNPKTPGRGIITGESLIDLDLSGLELAVLSACETGLGDVAGGEGTFGLQRAFHLAGTRDVIASLWKVPDAPTAALMAEFYRNLWTQNQPPLAALREAQLTIYRNPGKIAELAAGFRAGFKVLVGTPDDIEIKPTADGKTHPRMWAAFTLSGPGR